MDIDNTEPGFVMLWLQLERTRRLLRDCYRRYCIRNILKSWFGPDANDDFIWEVCFLASLDGLPAYGWDLLPPPALSPRRHRELLRAVVAARLGIRLSQVDQRALDRAYSIVFPGSTPLNVNKKKHQPQ